MKTAASFFFAEREVEAACGPQRLSSSRLAKKVPSAVAQAVAVLRRLIGEGTSEDVVDVSNG